MDKKIMYAVIGVSIVLLSLWMIPKTEYKDEEKNV